MLPKSLFLVVAKIGSKFILSVSNFARQCLNSFRALALSSLFVVRCFQTVPSSSQCPMATHTQFVQPVHGVSPGCLCASCYMIAALAFLFCKLPLASNTSTDVQAIVLKLSTREIKANFCGCAVRQSICSRCFLCCLKL